MKTIESGHSPESHHDPEDALIELGVVSVETRGSMNGDAHEGSIFHYAWD